MGEVAAQWLRALGDLGGVAIVAALVGALVGSGVTFLLSIWRDRNRENRESEAILRLLLGEIEHNTVITKSIQDPGSVMFASPRVSDMKTETWHSTRVRAAQLVQDDLLISLEAYYTPLETVLTLVGDEGTAQESAESWFRSALAERWGDEAKLALPTQYARVVCDAQKRVRKKIKEHLKIKDDDDPEP